jgi:hypothetical protein
MRKNHSQSGITLIGFLLILMVVGFFAFLGMRLFPVYTEYYGVLQAMKAVAAEPGIATKTPEQVKDSLDRKLYISYVTSVKKNNVRVTRQGGDYQLNVSYEVRGALVYNLEFIATFNHTETLTRGGAVL